MKLCSIDGCGRKFLARGFCRRHYYSQVQYGDPLASNILQTSYGEPRKFYEEVVLTYDGDECLIWPFARLDRGYAMMRTRGRSNRASKVLCEDVNGPPPSPKHEAAHSCGNGHLGCVTKKHLSWKTPSENQADRVIHGTDSRGEKNGYSKLDQDKVREICALKGSLTNRQIAKNYGISTTTVSEIQLGRSWKWLTREIGG